MPLLARIVAAPLYVDVRAGVIANLAASLADHRIAPSGKVAIVVGPNVGAEIAEALRPQLTVADVFTVESGSIDAARSLAETLRLASYDAIVGIGGGRTIDIAKYAGGLTGLPMVSVATTLAHDGIASPVASLESDGRKRSYGVPIPIAVFVDLDYVRRAPHHLALGGVGDVLSNLSAIADWELAAARKHEPVDGLAVAMARSAAESLLWREDGDTSDGFITSLAEALVLSGVAMSVSGTSRPCSGGEHKILHAIDELYPGTAGHGELAGLTANFCTHLSGDEALHADIDRCLARRSLPRHPQDVGMTAEQFSGVVAYAATTRPERWTILEQLALSEDEIDKQVDEFVARRS
jgi:glycerol-1-phosphate dehydrogenase [NAD(P)+]